MSNQIKRKLHRQNEVFAPHLIAKQQKLEPGVLSVNAYKVFSIRQLSEQCIVSRLKVCFANSPIAVCFNDVLGICAVFQSICLGGAGTVRSGQRRQRSARKSNAYRYRHGTEAFIGIGLTTTTYQIEANKCIITMASDRGSL